MNKRNNQYNQMYNKNNGQFEQTQQLHYPQNGQVYYNSAPQSKVVGPQPMRPQSVMLQQPMNQVVHPTQQFPVASMPYQPQQTATHAFFSKHNYYPTQEFAYSNQLVREKTRLEIKLDALEKMFNDRLINSEEYYERRKKWINQELDNLLK